MIPVTRKTLRRLLDGVTNEMVAESLAYREDPTDVASFSAVSNLEGTELSSSWCDVISLDGYELIVRWETGGKAYYDRIIQGRPVWPGYASGITIGCGFDLGYNTEETFITNWAGRIGAADLERLSNVIGFRTVAPDRALKVAQAKRLTETLSDIVVTWDTAIQQFDEVKLPGLIRQLYRALPSVKDLHPHCRAALLSLIFNRGASFAASGERFSEMRQIAEAIRAANSAALARVPALFRSMKRIWGEGSSLARRRESEALLFERGLEERIELESLFPYEQSKSGLIELESAANEQHDDLQVEATDVADDDESAAMSPSALESVSLNIDNVRWNVRDDEQPDYRHLDRSGAGRTFELLPADLELLISVNEFAIKQPLIIFALRGALLSGGTRIKSSAILVTDQRPDHRNYRCVIGVYDRNMGYLSAFQASTVPNANFVLKCATMAGRGASPSELTGNILPTGCYTYSVGTHRAGSRGEIPGVLRLSSTATGASQVVVLRSVSDLIYDRFDPFFVATPADNIHPGQLSDGFSSAGCLTLPGRYSNGKHHGLWSDFREAAGLDKARYGTQFSLLLITGLDAANAAMIRSKGGDPNSLRRLRHGSAGERVAALQAALGLKPDPSKLIGPITRYALIKRQIERLGWADGIYSPAMDRQLGYNLYK